MGERLAVILVSPWTRWPFSSIGFESDVGNGRRKNSAANREHAAGDANGFGKIPGDVRERGEKKIAEIVSDESVAGAEAILKKTAEQGLRLWKARPCNCECRRAEECDFRGANGRSCRRHR